jgi:hypothetical protein
MRIVPERRHNLLQIYMHIRVVLLSYI